MITDYLKKIKPQYSGYQELHVHTVGSFRDAANTVKDVFDAAEELGRNAVAITDHGNWTRLFEALKERTKREKMILEKELKCVGAAKEDVQSALRAMGVFDSVRNPNEKMIPFVEKYEDAYVNTVQKAIQFVPGIEMYESLPVENDDHRWHIVFYAKDWEGAQALFSMCNLAQLNKHNEMPRCTTDTMRLFLGEGSRGHGHVIATSACINGRLASTLLQPHYNAEAQKKLLDKQEQMTVIPPETIADGEVYIAELEAELARHRSALSEAKKIGKSNYESALKRARAALEKTMQKDVCGQVALEGAGDSLKLVAAKNKLREIEEKAEKASEVRTVLPQMEKDVAEIREKVKKAKEDLANMVKQNGPAKRIQAKIDALKEKSESLGDVYGQAKAAALAYEEILGKGNFFIELQDHGLLREILVRGQLIRLSQETGIPMTVANDVHYKDLKMKRKRDIIAALRFPNLTVFDVANETGNDQLYFKSNAEMESLFSDIPQAIENTCRIAEACNVYYHKEMHLPEFVDEEGALCPAEYLRQLAKNNILSRYPDYTKWEDERKKDFDARLEYELGVIEKMGYSSYIAIVEDFISYAKRSYGPDAVGPGRGSGAGSLVCYLIGITNIDPLRYDLIFERFLNPERVSMPDIDTDFAPSIRDKVVEYVANRYAYRQHYAVDALNGTVCSINTEGVLAARSAIRQVGKVTGVAYPICDKIAKLIPATVGMTLETALRDNGSLRELYEKDIEVKNLIDDALLVEGTPVQTGVHAAGVIIADKPISEYAPMFWNNEKNTWVIQYDMVSCESDLGLLKMDFLGLQNLDILVRTKSFIKKTKGSQTDFSAINDVNDAAVIDNIYGKGDTDGIFQFESGGMKQTLRSFVPKSIDDVILLNAAYRPGPMQYIPVVTDVKLGRSKAQYIVPEMAFILEATYGSPIYQEQIQRIFHEIAGFSLGQADVIRRAMSKKHLDELEAAKEKFTTGLKAKGASDADIEQFWDEILEFAKYAFNKSHAAAYSVVSYHTAWFKYYYPVEYMASLLSYTAKDGVALYVKDIKEHGINLLPPDINLSGVYTAPTKSGAIRFGLDGIKSVSAAAVKIVAERKKRGLYTSYKDFLLRCVLYGINKGAIESLIISGAVPAEFIKTRQMAVENLSLYINACKGAVKAALKKDDALCALMDSSKESANEILYERLSSPEGFQLPIPVVFDEYPDMLQREKEYTGYYASGHPLNKYKELMRRYTSRQISDLDHSEKEVVLAGYITDFQKLARKKDGESMCKFTLEDLTGSIEALCFAYQYKRLAGQLSEGAVVCLKGILEIEGDSEGSVTTRQYIVQSGRKIA